MSKRREGATSRKLPDHSEPVNLAKLAEVGHATEYGWQEDLIDHAIAEIVRLRRAACSAADELP